jgi:two-component system response regulator
MDFGLKPGTGHRSWLEKIAWGICPQRRTLLQLSKAQKQGAIQVDANRYNVLLVDDDLVQIDLARRAAAEACPEIDLTVVPGVEAVLDWFGPADTNREQLPHIILMDLKLPKLDGLAVLRTLRGHATTCDIPIVVFSAEYTQDDVLMSYKAGANSFMSRPGDLAQFAEFFRERLAYWMNSDQHELIAAAQDESAKRI